MILTWLLLFFTAFIILSYQNASLIIWTMGYAVLLTFATYFHGLTGVLISGWIVFLILFSFLNISILRRNIAVKILFKLYQKRMPKMSRTEREAIAAGTVSWEGELFRGRPHWDKLLSQPPAALTEEEAAFIAGPVETLCSMLNDWEITHHDMDMPPAVWDFLKQHGFFGLIIPKQYGGKAFSAYAHSQIITKIGSVSITAGSSVSVPNSLGPAELLLHYGTEAQKNYYLPRLASGEEIPCFALTSAYAGSDAGAMIDYGIVCREQINGVETLGIRLTFDKRYITLAPIATLIGLAFKLYDPNHLLGDQAELGITCALIPRETPGIEIGRRHFPLNTAFQNGPLSGKNIFISMDRVIGGRAQAGKGWRMLMECLAAGRAISLPSIAVAGAKTASFASGAYARIRKQFNQPIGEFEGIEEALARIGAYTYLADSARIFATGSIDAGEKPAIASAIVKYHCTELGRKVACDAMDIHGGKGICLGPKNYIGRSYQASPIAITVEGANILTRNMIIFGQGLMRCHPYLYAELNAALIPEKVSALIAFDHVIIKHASFTMSNAVRSMLLGLTNSKIVQAPAGKLKRFYQHATRFSSALAFLTDICLLIYGGKLKRKEFISARLGDILSYLYLLSAVLKRYHDEGEHELDLPVVRYAAVYCLFEIQEKFAEIFRNFSNRPLAWLLRTMIFPWGMNFSKPQDKTAHQVANLLLMPSDTRKRISAGLYLPNQSSNNMRQIQEALIQVIGIEPIEDLMHSAVKSGKINQYTPLEQARAALTQEIITQTEFDQWLAAEKARMAVIAVDAFENGF